MKMNHKMLARVVALTASSIAIAEPRVSAAIIDDSHGALAVQCERKSEFAVVKEHELRLVLSLRRITGYHALGFASDGSLYPGDCSGVSGGSAEARRILLKAFASVATFIIEDYSGSSSVTFGQAVREQLYSGRDGKSSSIWRLRLDFDDFQQIDASSEVRATFDEGFTFFHELLHGLGYKDAGRDRELGECEEIVNRIRNELGLPLRDHYFGEAWKITERLTSVRLRFRSPARNGTSRQQTRYLFFLLAERPDVSASVRALTRVDSR
jgi:hypothetical protein